MGLKIQTKIDDFDYPEKDSIILFYGEHEVDVRPYIMSFFLRSVLGFEPVEIDYFISKILEMLDNYIRQSDASLPSIDEMLSFRCKFTTELVKKVCEIHNSSLPKA